MQEREGLIYCVYLDFKKAFDRVSHQRLIWKLENRGGIKGQLMKWMESIVSETKMRKEIRGKFSSWREVKSGVPQGSVLNPIMLLIYTNGTIDDVGRDSYINVCR